MKYFVCVGLIFGILVVEALSVELPSGFRLCKRSSPNWGDCVSKAAQDAVAFLAPGLKSFKILPLDPLAVNSVTIGGLGGPVSLKQSYKNVKLHGLTRGLKIEEPYVDLDKCEIKYFGTHEQVDFVADYTVEGKILLLPVTGSGRSNITMLGLGSKATISCEKEERNGETYLNVKKFNIKFSPKKVLLKFDNLFNGDRILGDQMNKFINENSDLLFKELQGPYEETFGLVFAQISNAIFSRIPANKLFPE